jgi:hypothetical protein
MPDTTMGIFVYPCPSQSNSTYFLSKHWRRTLTGCNTWMITHSHPTLVTDHSSYHHARSLAESVNAGKRDVVKGFITERQMKYRVNVGTLSSRQR